MFTPLALHFGAEAQVCHYSGHRGVCINDELREAHPPDISPGLPFDGVAVAPVPANQIPDITTVRPASTQIRIALISSGVDTTVLPSPFSNQVVWQHYAGDTVGYGTYVASVIFQLHANAQITSLPIYPNSALSSTHVEWALKLVADWPGSFDAVVLAFPPSDFLHPITAAMASGGWDQVQDGIAISPFDLEEGKLFGLPTSEELFNSQGHSPYNQNFLRSFWIPTVHWDAAFKQISRITSAHIPVVAPAGDIGPNPQSVMGLANHPEVITVGGFNAPANTGSAGNVSTATSSGPSVDLKVKPDLLAPTGVIGVFPTDTALASHLGENGLIDNTLDPEWTESAPALSLPDRIQHALVDTTLVSAAIVGMAAGGIRAQGLAAAIPIELDVPHIKGALSAKSVFLPDVPVWKQGTGVLGGPDVSGTVPDLNFALTAPLVLRHASLGLEPSSGPWSATVPVANGTASIESVEVKDFIGVDFDATAKVATVTNSAAPTLTAGFDALSGITLTAQTGAFDKESGYYAGVLGVTLSQGVSQVTRTVPFDLTHGFRPIARSFAIHDDSAGEAGVSQTFSLSPALPPGASVLDDPLSMLPVNPMDTTFFFKMTEEVTCDKYPNLVTGTITQGTCQGHAGFDVVPPGYYSVRGWSDYGAPYQYTAQVSNTATSHTWQTDTLSDNLGGSVAYSSFKTLLLPAALDPDALNDPVTPTVRPCTESYGEWDDWSGHNGEPSNDSPPRTWKECTEDFLRQVVVTPTVTPTVYDPATGGFFVSTTYGPIPPTLTEITDDVVSTADVDLSKLLRVNLGFIRHAIQTQVSSRYIDIVRPCQHLRYLSFRTAYIASFYDLMHPTDTSQADWQTGCDNLETLLASYEEPDDSSTSSIGLARAHYAFNLPQPNYTAHMSLNFSYVVKNAFILVAAVVGNEVAVGLVTPEGVVQLPGETPSSPVDLGELQANAGGWATGTANFEFNFEPKNKVSQGEIYLWFTPWQYWDTLGIQQVISHVELRDNPETNDTFSFELRTWSPVSWPAINFQKRGEPKFTACKKVTPTALPDHDCGHNFRFQSHYNRTLYDPLSGSYVGGDNQIAEPAECREIEGEEQRPWEETPEGRRAQVCEDWTLIVHAPRDRGGEDSHSPANLMDLVELTTQGATTTYTSVADDLKEAGSRLYVPAPVTNTGFFLTAFSSGVTQAADTAALINAEFYTSNQFFELLPFPHSFIKDHRGTLEACINDSNPRWSTYTVGGQEFSSTTTYDSICGGTLTSTNWTPATATVACLPKEPPLADDPCEKGEAYAPPPELLPYVRYPNRFTYSTAI